MFTPFRSPKCSDEGVEGRYRIPRYDMGAVCFRADPNAGQHTEFDYERLKPALIPGVFQKCQYWQGKSELKFLTPFFAGEAKETHHGTTPALECLRRCI